LKDAKDRILCEYLALDTGQGGKGRENVYFIFA
jgi:hypothetical protein